MEEYANKVRDLRRALEELRHEKEASDIKAERIDELDQLNSELRRSNRSLEDKIARLCEAPFISDAFGQHESRLRFEDAAKGLKACFRACWPASNPPAVNSHGRGTLRGLRLRV